MHIDTRKETDETRICGHDRKAERWLPGCYKATTTEAYLSGYSGRYNSLVLFGSFGCTGTSMILDTRNATTGRGRWKSFGCRKGEQGHHLYLGVSDDGTNFEVEKRHSKGNVPFGGASLDGHMNAIFDEATQRWIGFLRCATLNSV